MPRINSQKFYASSIKTHGITAKGLNWNSKESQEVRFDVILDMLPDDLSEFSIADAGCGFGDFYLYMKKQNKNPKKYIGIDSLKEMCDIATKQTECEIIKADICTGLLPDADFYVCSGALNILERFETYQFISNCYESSKKAFIFNILFSDKESQTYNYFSLEHIKDIAKALKVKKMKTTLNYLDKDITVAFLKESD